LGAALKHPLEVSIPQNPNRSYAHHICIWGINPSYFRTEKKKPQKTIIEKEESMILAGGKLMYSTSQLICRFSTHNPA
jgi:hypothetical protein